MAECGNSPGEARLPRHVAIIMDGNGRWARQRGLSRIDGHRAGALAVKKVVEQSRRLGIRYLTLFSFSTENWRRPPDEIGGLMRLFEQYLDSELSNLLQHGIRLRVIGDLVKLPDGVTRAVLRNIKATAQNSAMDLILAVNYGAREEITRAAREMAEEVRDGKLSLQQIDEQCFGRRLFTADVPDPDLLIRTSGEQRISNFLLWQIAYTELMFVAECWPEFDERLYLSCLEAYKERERRFGAVSPLNDGASGSDGS